MARVLLEGLSKVYPGGITAAKDVDLEAADGEFIVLVGPSGCGKSTTLRMVAGLEEITTGRLTIGDRVVNEVAARDRNIAMVFQSYALYPHLTVRGNLAFGLERRRALKSPVRRLLSPLYRATARAEDADIARRVAAAAETLGITPLLERKPGALSGGQRQRVAVGRALVREPEVFLFDEPLSNLDAQLRVEMRAELKSLHEATGATMLYVTHDQEEAMTLGDRLVVMKDGIVQQIATPRETYDRPANRFVASFVGTPTMNFFEGILGSSGQVLIANGQNVEVPEVPPALREHAAERVVLGVRPDRLSFLPDVSRAALACEVVRIEDLGDRRDFHLALPGGVRWVARIDGHAENRVAPGPAVIHFDARDAHWFETGGVGKRIESAPAGPGSS